MKCIKHALSRHAILSIMNQFSDLIGQIIVGCRWSLSGMETIILHPKPTFGLSASSSPIALSAGTNETSTFSRAQCLSRVHRALNSFHAWSKGDRDMLWRKRNLKKKL